MDLIQIRTKFKEISGRYDLVNEDNSDNGANFYINEASKWLDRTIEHTKSWATYMAILSAGHWYLKFPNARAIKEVWVATAVGKWQLEKKRLQDLLSEFYTEPPALWSNAIPLYYAPALTRHIPDNISPATLATFATYVGVIPVLSPEYNAIVMSTPVDQNTLIEIVGLFYSMQLDRDTDQNYWSTVHPMLLVQATVRQTYVNSGNRPMLDTVNTAINDELTRISMDLVEQIIAEVDQMEG